jgi:predicted HAD superfamily Cof-like phosphohydrolase
MTIAEMLEEWHSAIGDEAEQQPSKVTARLRAKLIREETSEVCEELYQDSRSRLAKELADLAYVVFGTAREYGIPLEAVIEEVHRSNMTKLSPYVMRRADGKILKNTGYEEADVEKVLAHA